MKRGLNSKKEGQVWVETVIYTLIGLAIIGILLAAVKPKVDSMRDRIAIDQAIESLSIIDDKIQAVRAAPANRRLIKLKISKGKFVIDSEKNSIYWVLDSKYKYSEPGVPVTKGNMVILTTEASPWQIKIQIDYPFDLTYNGESVVDAKEFERAKLEYELFIENMETADNKVVIDIREK